MFDSNIFQEESVQYPPFDFIIRRSKSDQSIFKALNLSSNEAFKKQEDRSMLLTIENLMDKRDSSPKPKTMKKTIIKSKNRANRDYQKNICGYITKKIMREFISATYKETVEHLCQKYGADYTSTKAYYLKRIERVTGPCHIQGLLQPQNSEQIGIKKVFSDFFSWFLKERYIRYLLLEGKMEKKELYIRYKNEALIQIIHSNQWKQNQGVSETENSSVNNQL